MIQVIKEIQERVALCKTFLKPRDQRNLTKHLKYLNILTNEAVQNPYIANVLHRKKLEQLTRVAQCFTNPHTGRDELNKKFTEIEKILETLKFENISVPYLNIDSLTGVFVDKSGRPNEHSSYEQFYVDFYRDFDVLIQGENRVSLKLIYYKITLEKVILPSLIKKLETSTDSETCEKNLNILKQTFAEFDRLTNVIKTISDLSYPNLQAHKLVSKYEKTIFRPFLDSIIDSCCINKSNLQTLTRQLFEEELLNTHFYNKPEHLVLMLGISNQTLGNSTCSLAIPHSQKYLPSEWMLNCNDSTRLCIWERPLTASPENDSWDIIYSHNINSVFDPNDQHSNTLTVHPTLINLGQKISISSDISSDTSVQQSTFRIGAADLELTLPDLNSTMPLFTSRQQMQNTKDTISPKLKPDNTSQSKRSFVGPLVMTTFILCIIASMIVLSLNPLLIFPFCAAGFIFFSVVQTVINKAVELIKRKTDVKNQPNPHSNENIVTANLQLEQDSFSYRLASIKDKLSKQTSEEKQKQDQIYNALIANVKPTFKMPLKGVLKDIVINPFRSAELIPTTSEPTPLVFSAGRRVQPTIEEFATQESSIRGNIDQERTKKLNEIISRFNTAGHRTQYFKRSTFN